MEALHGSPLKAPAIEVIPIPSEQAPEDEEKLEVHRHDASSSDVDDEEDDDHLSLYEDMLDGMPEKSDWKGGSLISKAWRMSPSY